MRIGHRKNGGVTLIEVLVALLVLSVGLVGIASLLLFSVRSIHSSYQTSIASVISLDVEEWLWEALRDDAGVGVDGCPVFSDVLDRVQTHWARAGAVEGRNGVRVTLPNLSIGIVGPVQTFPAGAADPDRVRGRIAVQWDEGRFGGSNETFEYQVQVPCRVGG